MTNWYRVLVGLLALAAMLLLASCSGAPGCNPVSFGSGGCTGSGSTGFSGGGGTGGGGGGGGSNATPTAFVYAVDQNTTGSGTTGTIDGYDLSNSAGTFVALSGYTAPAIPASEFAQGMVVVNKQFIYAVFELQQQLYGWSVDATSGALTTLPGFPMTVSLNLPIVSYNTYQVTSDPAGNFLFLSSSGANDIFVYTIDASTGALTAVAGSPFTTPIEPGNITTDGLGRFLYVCDGGVHGEGANFIAYAIGTGGVLTAIPGFFGSNIWELQGDASGRFLVGTSGSTLSFTGVDDDHLYVFSIDQTTGVPTQVATSPVSTTYSPFTIAMQPASSNGEYVYSFGINDTGTGFNPIEGYSLNTTTGALTPITGSPFSNNVFEGQWGQFDQSGTNLLVYSAVLTGSGVVAQVGPMQVASDGTLTDPVSPVTLGTPGYWVVTDP
jgi:hypothetical protein